MSTTNNPFVLPVEQYNRDLNILKYYIEDSARYIEQMSGKPYDDCLAFVKKSVKPGGQFEFKDPEVIYLERGENGDREKKQGKLSEYIGEAIRDGELIAPTFTTYHSEKTKKSLLVDFIDGNVAGRSKAKKEMFAAIVAGDVALETIKNIEQTNRKLSNNALSGAHVSSSTPLNNKTAHSTLTSNCRTTSGYGNANNEKFLCGNRHYWSVDIARNNIISIINHSDFVAIEAAMKEFGLRHPTKQETVDMVFYSTDMYWSTKSQKDSLKELIYTLNDLQRSAFVYTGDLYHLMKFNDKAIHDFITKLSKKVVAEQADPKAIISASPEDNRNLASQICSEEMKGKTAKDIVGTPAYHTYASTIQNIGNVLEEYRNMIRAFWVTPNVPASVAFFPDSIRRCVVTSDTDSTIFTVQDWVKWHTGKLGFDDVSNAVAASLIFLASQTITHVLAIMSANFGIAKERLFQVAMKNEFKFDVFVPTQVAKHYYALIGCREGNVYAKYKEEIKGVHLKASNAPRIVMKEAKKMMLSIMNDILAEKELSLEEILGKVSDVENDIIRSISTGGYEYFKRTQIKPAEAYKNGETTANFVQYKLWQDVFAPKYGDAPPPPYMGIKISTDLKSPTQTRMWVEKIEDRELAARMQNWLVKNEKNSLGGTMIIPEHIMQTSGIPKEMYDVVGVRKIISDSTRVFYIILESIGWYISNDRITRLVSDHY